MSTEPNHSTGRGGAGNIGQDPNIYTDGGVIREGIEGVSPEGEYSTGRGGAGNIGKSPNLAAQPDTRRHSTDIIPEINQREPQEEFHTGRGGAGNVYKEKHGGHSSSPERKGLGDKVKHALHLDKKDKHEPSPLAKNDTVN